MTDLINKPPHYIGKNGIEAADVVEAFELNHRCSAAVEYILRHERKGNPIDDLEKAIWNLQREVKRRKEAERVGESVEGYGLCIDPTCGICHPNAHGRLASGHPHTMMQEQSRLFETTLDQMQQMREKGE